MHELHALLAPRPFLLSGGSEDPPERWRALNHLVQINQLLGHEDRVGMTTRPNHEPTEESNAVIYAFFRAFSEEVSRSAKAEVAERIAEEIERRRERGEPFQQLQVASKRGDLCGEFWGQTWCNNLEAYSDYEDRLPRGKSYLRAGNVYDLTIDPGGDFRLRDWGRDLRSVDQDRSGFG